MSTAELMQQQKPIQSSKSLESLYSTSSSKQSNNLTMYKRRQPRQTMVPAVGEVRQRVISARLHRMRNLQNQLNDAQQHMAELINENRLLRSLHKRQDSALAKYESSNAELPQLLHSHAEEIRMWQTKCRNLQNQTKELTAKIKQKDSALLILTDQNKHLMQLSMDKHLEEREKLTERVRYLEMRIMEKDEEMKVLLRRNQLEAKSFKTQLNTEQSKLKEMLHKMEKVTSDYEKKFASSSETTLGGSSKSSLTQILKAPNNIASVKQTIKMNKNNSIYLAETSVHQTRDTNFIPKMSPKNKTASPKSTLAPVAPPSSQSLQITTVDELDTPDAECIITSKPIQSNSLANLVKNGMKPLVADEDEYSFEEEEEEEEQEDEEEQEQNHVGEIEKKDVFESDGDRTETDGDVTARSTETYSHNGSSTNEHHELDDNKSDSIKADLHDDILRSESFLDSLCDNATKDISFLDKRTNFKMASTTKAGKYQSNIPAAKSRRQVIDPSQKSKLLEALRAIDSN